MEFNCISMANWYKAFLLHVNRLPIQSVILIERGWFAKHFGPGKIFSSFFFFCSCKYIGSDHIFFFYLYRRIGVPAVLWFIVASYWCSLSLLGHSMFCRCFAPIRELSFFTGRGGHPSVIAGCQFFLAPPFHTAKKIWPPLLTYTKNSGPPLDSGKKFCPPPRTKNPLLINNGVSLNTYI